MIAKRTNDATSSSAASIASSSSVASPRVTRKPPELSSPCYALQPQGFGLNLSTRPLVTPRKSAKAAARCNDRILALPGGAPLCFAVAKAKQDVADIRQDSCISLTAKPLRLVYLVSKLRLKLAGLGAS